LVGVTGSKIARKLTETQNSRKAEQFKNAYFLHSLTTVFQGSLKVPNILPSEWQQLHLLLFEKKNE